MRVSRLQIILLVIAAISFTVAIVWWLTDIDLEPLLAVLAGFVSLLTALVNIAQQNRDDTDDDLTPDQRNRRDLIAAVRRNWIEGVLHDSLRDVQLQIPLKTDPDRAAQSERYRTYQPEQPTTTRPPDFFQRISLILRRENTADQTTPNTPENIHQIFTNLDHKLLILGEPASGKTVLMLQLAERLLQDVTATNTERLPLVFNLSSWASDPDQTIADWLIDRLKVDYGASKPLAQQLVTRNRVIFLLDGLDEVAAAHRSACLAALNAFITPDTQLVVCSRLTEFEQLQDTLDVHNALMLQPPTPKAFRDYLVDGGLAPATADALLADLTTTADIWQQSRKPLFANVLIDTYADRTHIPPLTTTDPLQRIHQRVIAPYITRQLNRPDKPYPDTDTRRYLAWVGWQMNQHEMTTFYTEAFQVDWLHRPTTRRILRITFALLFSLIYGLLFGLSGGLISGLLFGLFFGLIGGLSTINILRKVSLNIPKFTEEDLQRTLFTGLVAGLIAGLGGVLIWGPIWGLIAGLVAGLIVGGLFYGLGGWLLSGLLGTLTVYSWSRLNQGLQETLLFALLYALLTGAIFALVGGLLGGLLVGLVDGLIGGLLVGLLIGLLFGTLCGIQIVANDIIQHLILRTILHRTGHFP